jgi:hypothetical protein
MAKRRDQKGWAELMPDEKLDWLLPGIDVRGKGQGAMGPLLDVLAQIKLEVRRLRWQRDDLVRRLRAGK